MPKITITAETRSKVEAFRSLGSAVTGHDMTLDDCAEILVLLGLQAALEGLLTGQDSLTMTQTVLQLAQAHPEVVYPFMAAIWQRGDEAQKEGARRRILGFRPPEKPDEK